jgi:hypothetical protein
MYHSCVLSLYLINSILTGVYLTFTLYDPLTEGYLTCNLIDQLSLRYTWLAPYIINSHWWVLIIWGIIQVYLSESSSYKVRIKYTSESDEQQRYKSGTPQWELTILGTSQIHLSESWPFKVQVKYTSVRIDHLRYSSSTHQSELII